MEFFVCKFLGRIKRRLACYGFSYALSYILHLLQLKIYRRLKNKPSVFRIHNYRMLLDPCDAGVSSQLIVDRTREQQLKYILEQEITQGDTIVDLGANIGYYALMEWKLSGAEGVVYALEPSPDNFKLLQQNIFLNNAQKWIFPYQLAGGDTAKKAAFYLSEHSNLNTFIPDLYRCGERQKYLSEDAVEIDMVDMTSFLQDKLPTDLIRMDVEGYEVEVLQGLQKAIETHLFTGKIVFECHFPKYDDEKHSMRNQLRMLFKNGYVPKIMTSNNEASTPFAGKGYRPTVNIRTSPNTLQGIYYNIDPEDAEYFICDTGGVRDVLLEKRT